MSADRWQSGDVAMIPGVGRAIAIGDEDRALVARESNQVRRLDNFDGVRRLAVFDPEDAEQVRILVDQFMGQWSGCEGSRVGAMQGVLRVFAGPVKPDEPMGLGAVVQTTGGRRYVRWAQGEFDGRAWAPEDGRDNALRWKHLAAVKVLSEGVTG